MEACLYPFGDYPVIVRADALRIPLATKSCDIVIGSPPYLDARTYLEDGKDLGISRDCNEWILWMLQITAESLRVSKGLVLWVVAGVTRDRNYQPGPEGLLYRWWAAGGECHCLRPVIWHRSGVPGSGGDEWFRPDTEYVLAFKRPGKLPWADNLANGQPPKWSPGGAMSNRSKDGTRANARVGGKGARRANGKSRSTEPWSSQAGYSEPDIANPGNFFSTGPTGGGHLGNPLAHDNEAPYPVAVPAWFIASHCPVGGLVCDPFAGSGTTLDAALSLGRRGIGFDLRQSQCKLSRKRLATVTPGFAFADEPTADVVRTVSQYDPDPPVKPLPGQGDLFGEMGAAS
jgi:hypothetical protein